MSQHAGGIAAALSPIVWLVRRLLLAVSIAVAALLLFTVAGFGGRWAWQCELFCHFRVQYFWLLLAAGALLLVARWWRMASAAFLAAMLNFALFAPLYWPVPSQSTAGKSLTIVSFNVLGSNERYADVFQWLRSQDADVVLLMEVRPAWAEHIELLADRYPYRHVVARPDNFGIALLSGEPWEKVETHIFGTADVPSIVAQFNTGQQRFAIVGTHPFPPVSQLAARRRNEQLAEVATFLAAADCPTVLVGDLNITSHSPFFGDLLRVGRLRDSRQGFGIQPSWHSPVPLLSLAIDHCLVSDHWVTVDRHLGPPLGSDHRPVVVQLRLVNP